VAGKRGANPPIGGARARGDWHTMRLPNLPFALALALGAAAAFAQTKPPARPPAPPPAVTPAPTPAAGSSRCVDEDAPLPAAGPDVATPGADPRGALAAMVREALARSQTVGAARLLADAAKDDIDEARAGHDVQAAVNGGLGPVGQRSGGINETQSLQARAGLTIGQTHLLTSWRTLLADAARLGQVSQQEQLAFNTVALALERSRYRQHVAIYGQYVRKMACLSDALETIVRSDRGRASELVQARKSLQQAELAQAQAQSSVRQTEIRLRRLVGDGLASGEGLSALLLQVPGLPELQAEAERATDIAQLGAQAAASSRYADSVAASAKPVIGWSIAAGATAGRGGTLGPQKTGNYALGLSLTIPLTNGAVHAASAAARKRAEVAQLQLADALESRVARVAEVYEQTTSSFDRARRYGAVLKDSEQLRNFTLQQWQQLGRRSLFDVMGTEAEHYALRVSYVNALHDGQQLNALLLSLGRGVGEWLR
jgi:outer membrane protein TolC